MKLNLMLRFLLILVCGCTSHSLLAQDAATGALTGTIYDPSGAAVPNAHILLSASATHATRAVTANAQGIYRAAFLLPGEYTVTASAPAFAAKVASGVNVTVSETAQLNIVLAVEGVGVSIHVVDEVALAQTETSSLGRAVDSDAIEALPLASRNYTQLLGLSPGVIVELPDHTQLGSGTQNVSSNGAKTVSNNIQFNGVDANNLAQNSAANDAEETGTGIPSPDAIQEFKVQTANFDAAFGRGAGANVDLITKSGTNRFHGSAWEFFRNTVLNANDFFAKRTGQPRGVLNQNQFGGALGGPIRKDRTFFFVAYEGLAERNGIGVRQSTLLPLLTSDRSAATLGAQFCPAGHLVGGAPSSGYLTNAGGTQVACDGSNINPVAIAILNAKLPDGTFAVPSPQVPQATTPSQLPVGLSTFAPPARYRGDQFTIDADHTISAANTLSEKFFYSRSTTDSPFAPNAANVPGWGSNVLTRNTNFVLADTHVFNANFLNVARVGFIRFDGLLKVQNPLLASAIGQGTPTGLVGPDTGAPGLSISGLFTIGDAGTPSQWQVTNTFIYQDTVSFNRGRHNLRAGAEFKRDQLGLDVLFVKDGLTNIASFPDFLVGQSAAQNGSPTGSSNVALSVGASGLGRKDTRYNDFSTFVQDDWKLAPRLTLNLGLRYEIFGAPYEIHGLLPNFDPALATGRAPAAGTFSGYVLPSNFSGPVPAGYTKLSRRSLWQTPYGDVSPRFGFAWQLHDKPTLVLRGGYGLYYDRHSGDYAESLQGQPPFASFQIAFGAANAGATLQNPFSPLLPTPSSFPLFAPRVAGGAPFTEGVSPNTVDGRTQEYNLNLQTVVAADTLLEIGYVGTRSTNRPGSIEFNQALLASPSNPVNGETTNSTNNLIQRLPFDGVSPGSLFTNSNFIANYNSLQASLTKRLAHGLQFLASYTWSKSLDETSGSGGSNVFELFLPTNDQNNPRQAYGVTDFDRTHRGVLSFVYQAPRFESMHALPRHLLAGWEFSGIAVAQSGSPITVTDGNAGSVYGNFENRAQRTGSNPATQGSLFSRVTGLFLDPAAFTRAPEVANGTSLADQDFGASGVGIVRGPAQRNIDFAVERIFPIVESANIHFRTEFFNLFNTPIFANPNNNLGFGDPNDPNPTPSPAFGTILSSSANPRIIQFALKVVF